MLVLTRVANPCHVHGHGFGVRFHAHLIYPKILGLCELTKALPAAHLGGGASLTPARWAVHVLQLLTLIRSRAKNASVMPFGWVGAGSAGTARRQQLTEIAAGDGSDGPGRSPLFA